MSDLWDEEFFSESLLDREYRAWACLQWSPGSAGEPFCEHKAQDRFYSSAQKWRSDFAVKQFDELNDLRWSHMSELDCFRELERLGILSQADFYSPSNAAKRFYSKLLREQSNATTRRTQQRTVASSLESAERANQGMDRDRGIRRRSDYQGQKRGKRSSSGNHRF